MDNSTTLDWLHTESSTDTQTTTNLYPWDPSPENNNQTNLTTAGVTVEWRLSAAAVWTYFAVRLLWGGLAIFGNSLTILAVTRFERLQTCTNYFICSLAVSDLLSVVPIPFILVYELYPDRWFFIPVCLFQKILSMMSSGGNLMNLLYLSIDRYIYIAYPLRYHLVVTPQRTWIIIAVTWLWSLVITPTIMIRENHLQLGMPCQYHIFLNDWVMRFYLAPQFALVFVLTIGFHLAIAKIAHKQARQIAAEQQPYNTLAVAIHQSTKNIRRTFGLVLGVYMLSYMPQTIMGIIVKDDNSSLIRYMTMFYWANTCVNPLIYAFRLKDFRIAFRKILTGTGHFIEVPGMAA